ncbi:MAG: nucleotide exchange factor GrpE [Dehalococcoidia bacterium]
MVESNQAAEGEDRQVEDMEALQQALTEERERAEKYLASWQRTQADLANYKQRAELERKETIEFANSVLISSLLPVIDDLERALASVPAELEQSSWTQGIALIYNKLKATLRSQGLTDIEAIGESFDPRLHEAVMQQEGEEGVVVDETQRGYKFRDRVIRPSLVIVGTGQARDETKQTSQEEE